MASRGDPADDIRALQNLDFPSARDRYSSPALRARKRHAAGAAAGVVFLSLTLAVLLATRSLLPALVDTALSIGWIVAVATAIARLLRAGSRHQ